MALRAIRQVIGFARSERRALNNLLLLFAVQVSNYGFALIAVPLLAHRLSTEGYGVVALAISTNAYLWLLVDWGFSLAATSRVARSRDDPDELGNILVQTIIAKLFLVGAAAGVVLLVAGTTSLPHLPLLILPALLNMTGAALSCDWFFQGMERMIAPTLSAVISRGLPVVAIVFLVAGPQDLWIACALQGVGGFLYGVSTFLLVRRRVAWSRAPSIRATVERIIGNRHYFLTQIGGLVNTAGAPLALGVASSAHQLGLYAGAEKIVRICASVPTPLTVALFPRVNNLIERSPEKASRLSLLALAGLVIYGLMVGAGLVLFGPSVIRLLLGAPFAEAQSSLSVLLAFPFLYVANAALSNQFLLPLGYSRSVARVSMFSACLYVPLLIVGARQAGALGAAWALVTAEGATALLLTGLVLVRGRAYLASAWTRTPVA